VTPAPTLDWQAEPLQAALQALRPGLLVQVLGEDASTNSTLVARIRAAGPAATACLLAAEHQTAGRGRMGRSWHARRGDSLTFSLALPCTPADWSGLSLAVGVALADALDPVGAIGLKWPNDLWLQGGQASVGRKLGGILIETVVAAGGARHCVIGVGLNVRALCSQGPQQPHDTAFATGLASLQELDPGASAPAVLHRVAEPLLRAVLRFEREGFAAFAEGFARRDLLRGREVTTTQPGLDAGMAAGVDADGALLLRDDAGRLHRLSAGEVSVRPAQASREAA
jgi:BirA family biotin operon repressor/biotin-[acetyl-CoA-carboxylase] ligase